jgi:hypothetical protein
MDWTFFFKNNCLVLLPLFHNQARPKRLYNLRSLHISVYLHIVRKILPKCLLIKKYGYHKYAQARRAAHEQACPEWRGYIKWIRVTSLLAAVSGDAFSSVGCCFTEFSCLNLVPFTFVGQHVKSKFYNSLRIT